MRKYLLIILAVFASAAAYSALAWFSSCQGRMQECYASFRTATSNADDATLARQRVIHGGFGASQSMVAFPMPLADGRSGIVLIDRGTGKPGLIAPTDYTHWAPHFSPDGQRLGFVRQRKGSAERELLSCRVAAWQCDVLTRANAAISSAVDIGNDTAIFAMNALRAGDKETMKRFDLFAVRKGQSPVRLTEHEAFAISSLSAGGGKIAFGAEGGQGFEPHRCEYWDSLKCDESKIYILTLAGSETTRLNGPTTLKPSLMLPGYSVRASLSNDGKRAGVLNTSRRGISWRYNMFIADIGGDIVDEIKVEGSAFSSGIFVDGTLLFNELFDDRYRVRAFDVASRQVNDLELSLSPESLSAIQPIALSVSN